MKKTITLLLLLTTAIAARNARGGGARITERKSGKYVKRQVLVLNFVNQQNLPAYGYLSTSISEAIIGPLIDTGQFTIMPADTGAALAKKYGIANKDLATSAAAQKLGQAARADVVVVGRYMVIKNTMQIQAKAIDTPTGRVKVSKKIRSKTDASMFTSIDELASRMAKAMTKALPPLEQKLVLRDEKRWYEDKLSLGAYSGYNSPMSSTKSSFDPTLYFQGNVSFQMLSVVGIDLGPTLGGGYTKHPTAPSRNEVNTLQIINIFGGLETGYIMPFHRPLSAHILLQSGLAISTLNSSLSGSTSALAPLLYPGLEFRYLVWRGISVVMSASYYHVLYTGTDLQDLQAGGGLRYTF